MAATQRLNRFLPDKQRQLDELNLRMRSEDYGPADLQLRLLAGHGFPLYRGCKTYYFDEGEEQFRRFEEVHTQKAYSMEQVLKLLEQAGLKTGPVYDGYIDQPANEHSERLVFTAWEQQK